MNEEATASTAEAQCATRWRPGAVVHVKQGTKGANRLAIVTAGADAGGIARFCLDDGSVHVQYLEEPLDRAWVSFAGLTAMTDPTTIQDEKLRTVLATSQDKLLRAVSTFVFGRTTQRSESSVHACSCCQGLRASLTCLSCERCYHPACVGLEPTAACDQILCADCVGVQTSCGRCGLGSRPGNPLLRCSCNGPVSLFHAACAAAFPGNSCASGGLCSAHRCLKCDGSSSSLMQCMLCPTAYHPDCVPSGSDICQKKRGRIVCPRHLALTLRDTSASDTHSSQCNACDVEEGALLCCQTCPDSFHLSCLRPALPEAPPGEWFCHGCAIRRLPRTNDIVWTRLGSQRPWPSRILPAADIPPAVAKSKHADRDICIRFYGGQGLCAWVGAHQLIPFDPTDSFSKSQTFHKERDRADYTLALQQATEAFGSASISNGKSARPPEFERIRTNRYPPGMSARDTMDHLMDSGCGCPATTRCSASSSCLNRSLMIECSPSTCASKDACENTLIQKRMWKKNEVRLTAGRGWGLFAAENIKAGDFVIEYCGEVIDKRIMTSRLEADAGRRFNYYILALTAHHWIDAADMGNVSRFINHSCSPNCDVQKWMVAGVPRVGIFAKADIPAGTEFTYDYKYESMVPGEQKCRCGAPNCSQMIGKRPSAVKPAAQPKQETKRGRPPSSPAAKPRKQRRVWDDVCFICSDGGSLACCDRIGCTRVYHLDCLGRTEVRGKWTCPVHFCDGCGAAAVSFCTSCPTSFCGKHDAIKGAAKCEECLEEAV